MRAMLLNRSVRWVFVPLLASAVACSGGDDGDGGDRDATPAPVRDGGVARDGGDTTVRDGGEEADAGMDRDAGPPDSGEIDPMSEPYRTRRNSGDPANRVDIVIVSEGYTLAELTSDFHEDVGDAIGRTFSQQNRQNNATEPFRTYRDYFNVHQIHLVSNESGIDTTGNPVDTALDAQALPCGGVGGSGACPLDFAKAEAAITAALAGSGIEPDIKVVLLNVETNEARAYFPPEGPYVVLGARTGDATNRSEQFMREIAVAWAGLAYETTDDPGGAYPDATATAANTSTSADGAWAVWDGYAYNGERLNMAGNQALNPVGNYEGGAGYATGIYRPSRNSKLGTFIPGPFNAVSREAIVLKIYDHVDLIETHLDNSTRLTNPAQVWVQPLRTSMVEWTFDGTVVTQVTQTTFGPVAYAQLEGIGPGIYTVSARVRDSTSYVRRNLETLTSSVSWEIELTP